MKKNIGVIYDDKRYKYMIYKLVEMGYEVYVLGGQHLEKQNIVHIDNANLLPEDLAALILPVRGIESDYSVISRASNKSYFFGKELLKELEQNSKIIGIVQKKYIDIHNIVLLNNDESFALRNALLTAEGSVYALMDLTEKTLRDTQTYILGYGRCGKALARLLKALDVKVTIVARRDVSRAEAYRDGFIAIDYTAFISNIKNAEVIFNTVPAPVLCECVLKKANPNTIIIDLASSPGGTDFQIAKELGITAVLIPGIPGKYLPLTAGEIIAEYIMKEIRGGL